MDVAQGVNTCRKRGSRVMLLFLAWSAASLSFANTYEAKVVHVSDGDTVTIITTLPCPSHEDCTEPQIQRSRVRLAEIDAPERGQAYGAKARDALAAMVAGKTVLVKQTDTDFYGRIVAHLYVDQKWVNEALVERGAAWVYRRYSKTQSLLATEARAKREKVGLWALPPSEQTPPWEWRRSNR